MYDRFPFSARALRGSLMLACLMAFATGIAPRQTHAQSRVSDWGMYATTAAVHCYFFVFWCGYATELVFYGISDVGPDMGGPGALSASAERVFDPDTSPAGSAQVAVQLAGPLAAPQITADATSTDDHWIQSNGFGIQGYVYKGAMTTDITLNVSLTGFVLYDYPAGYDTTGLSAIVALYEPTPDFVNPQPGDVRTLAAAILAQPSTVTYEAEVTNPDDEMTGSVMRNGGVTLTDVDPEDEFYVLVIMAASAGEENSAAHSNNTLSVAFSDPDGLIPVAGPLGLLRSTPDLVLPNRGGWRVILGQ